MKYILDTNICIYWLKGMYCIKEKISKLPTDEDNISVSIITISELLYGAYNSKNIEKNLFMVKNFINATNVINLDMNSIEMYATIKAKLKTSGNIIDDFDILIAATAISNKCIIVTNNVKHFERIENIQIENWVNEDF
jgi:tRNA(fMet)-specific endonuclease VapC